MRIGAIQNYNNTSYNQFRSGIVFRGFDTSGIKNYMDMVLPGIHVKNKAEADNVSAEVKRISTASKLFSEAKFNLHDYEKSFNGYKKIAFDEYLSGLGKQADDFPIKISYSDDDCIGYNQIIFTFPRRGRIHHIAHRWTLSRRKDMDYFVVHCNNGTKEGIEYKHEGYENGLFGYSTHFAPYPESVDGIKDFIVGAIDICILTPRAYELEEEEARRTTQTANKYLQKKLAELE